MLHVAGCSNQTVSNIIKGSYSVQGQNHGRHVYKKEGATGSVSVLIYYWDERDGPSFSGWWFGPKVGGDQVWAYNGDKGTVAPPVSNWKVPWDGPVDPSLRLQVGGGGGGGGFGREEEDQRREMEMRRRREEDDVRRKEQQAALAVRKVIQRVRVATPETYDSLRTELEEAQARHLEELGSQAQKVTQEAQETLQQAQHRIDEINERRVEDERKAKEDAEKVDRLIKEVAVEVKEGEEKVLEATEQGKCIMEGPSGTPEEMVDNADATEKVVEVSKTVLEKIIHSVDEKWTEMGNSAAARGVRREMEDLHSKLMHGKRTLESLTSAVASTRDKAARKTVAMKKNEERRAFFDKHDTDQDGQLNREEVLAYSQAIFDGFEPEEVVLDKIMRILEPITIERFHDMHVKVAIAQSEIKAREKRAIEAERLAKVEEQRQEVQKIVDEAVEFLSAAEAITVEAETKARPLGKDSLDMTAAEIEATAIEADELSKKNEGDLASAMEKLAAVEEVCAENPELKGFDVPRLRKRHEAIKGRSDKVAMNMKKARERAVRKAYAEMDQKRLELAQAIRAHMVQEGKTNEELYTSINDDSPISKEKFVEFVKSLTDLNMDPELADKLFDHIASPGTELEKERWAEFLRLYFKCVKATPLHEESDVKSNILRRLEAGEMLEVLEGPTKDEEMGTERVKCYCVADELVGWVTMAGNQGTPFLEPGGNFYTVVKETLLTDALSVQDSKTVRRIARGELIEVLEFGKTDPSVDVKRIKGKAKVDGATGWITVASNQGTVFLEPA